MNARKSILSATGIVVGALALMPLAYGADVTDRTSMPEACAERDVNCILPDGGPPRPMSRGGTTGIQAPQPGDNTVIVTPSAGFTPAPNVGTTTPSATSSGGASISGRAGQGTGATGSTSGSSGLRSGASGR